MNDKILQKIKKCLRLAQSSNPNEAAAAMRQAQKLMEIHDVTSDDVQISDVDSHTAATGAGKTPPAYLAMLANMVASAFGSETIYKSGADFLRYRWVGQFEFYGVNGAGEISGYAFEVLARQLKKHRTDYLATLNKRLKRTTKVRRGDLYAEAWIDAVSRQITPHTRTEADNLVLETYKQSRFKNGLSNLKPRDNTKGMRHHDDGAVAAGYRDGKKVKFHQGVNGSRQAALESEAQS
ncbi:DUF2786 domain-containing protein [Marinobacter sp.]|uniref:DUF2786 domain-containing protein n=1 Tax=Marinobacter sp. TaxID=50741 RepID=UPI0034A218CB